MHGWNTSRWCCCFCWGCILCAGASGRSVFYTVNRHINLTNICSSNCPLCAFQVEKGDARGYVLSLEDLDQRLAAAAKVPELSEIHIVSALHPEEPFSYYVDVVRAVRADTG